MNLVHKKNKRDTILYVRVTAANKAFLEKEADRLNYATLSEYVDALINELNIKPKHKKNK